MRALEREYQTLRHSPRPARPVNYPTKLDYEVNVPGWEEDEASGVHNGRVLNEYVDVGQLVLDTDFGAGWASYYNSSFSVNGNFRFGLG